ncbi:hypothetical protein [Trueperella pyogenes]|uniref:hypothetical protein n=1 Tax=Trueperella pyogenes TaxID=1661 RepID=UPI00345D9C82
MTGENNGRPPMGRIALGLILLAVLVVGLIVLVILGMRNDPTSHEATPQVPVATRSTQPDSLFDAACGYQPNDRSKPDRTFATTRVQTASGINIAAADGIGPCQVDPVPHGYAFTPKGALLAGVNFVASLTGHPNKTDIAQYQLISSPMREKILSQEPVTALTARANVEGFKTTMINDYEFTVDVAFSSADTMRKIYAMSLSVVWKDHDWRIALSDRGLRGYPVTDLVTEGFQRWGY